LQSSRESWCNAVSGSVKSSSETYKLAKHESKFLMLKVIAIISVNLRHF